jgi:effector-binding domain-containing protein
VTATWLLLAIGLLTAAGDARAIERLSYRTIEQDGDVELRRIESHVVAETFVEGDFERVGNEGFRRLVEYIDSANRKQAEIAMKAPVGQAKVGDRYRITFFMPSKYALEDLPQPTDERIRLREEPARTVAAIRYTGFWSRSRYDVHERKLSEWIQSRGLESVGEPVWARYHAPFMPWFLRRNEILIEPCASVDAET